MAALGLNMTSPVSTYTLAVQNNVSHSRKSLAFSTPESNFNNMLFSPELSIFTTTLPLQKFSPLPPSSSRSFLSTSTSTPPSVSFLITKPSSTTKVTLPKNKRVSLKTEKYTVPNRNNQNRNDREFRQKILIGAIHTVGLLLALIGNSSVIIIIARNQKLHTLSSVLVIVLAVSDLSLSLIWNVVAMSAKFSLQQNWMAEPGGICNFIGFSWQTLLTISTMFHAIVALDRYLFIVHPMKYQVNVTLKATSIVISAVILGACVLSCLTFIVNSEFRYLKEASMCTGAPLWWALYLFIVFIPSLIIALFAYQRIWRLCSTIYKEVSQELIKHHGRRSFLGNVLPLSLSSRNPSMIGQSIISETATDTINTATMVKEKISTLSKCATSTTAYNKTTVQTTTNTLTTTIAHGPCEIKSVLGDVTGEDIINMAGLSVKSDDPGIPRTSIRVETETLTERKETRRITVCSASMSQLSDESKLRNAGKKSKTTVISVEENMRKKSTSTKNKSKSWSNIFHINKKNNQNVKAPQIITSSFDNASVIESQSISVPSLKLTPSFQRQYSSDTACAANVSNNLFGQDIILPSLLYVAILMPLSMKPSASKTKQKHLRACLLTTLPVIIMAVSFLPLPISVLYMNLIDTEQSSNIIMYSHIPHSNDGEMFLINMICHFSYALVPSFTSLVLCLSNKPYRRALRNALWCCRCF